MARLVVHKEDLSGGHDACSARLHHTLAQTVDAVTDRHATLRAAHHAPSITIHKAGRSIGKQIAGRIVAVGFGGRRAAGGREAVAGAVDGVGVTARTDGQLGAVAGQVVGVALAGARCREGGQPVQIIVGKGGVGRQRRAAGGAGGRVGVVHRRDARGGIVAHRAQQAAGGHPTAAAGVDHAQRILRDAALGIDAARVQGTITPGPADGHTDGIVLGSIATTPACPRGKETPIPVLI